MLSVSSSSVRLISSGSTLKTLLFQRVTLRHSLAQGDLLGTTGLVASSGPAAQNLCHLMFWETGGIFPVQSQTQENSSAGAGLALLMAQSKPAKVEAPEGCLRDGETPPGMGGPHSLHGEAPARPSPSSGAEQPHAHGAGLSS